MRKTTRQLQREYELWQLPQRLYTAQVLPIETLHETPTRGFDWFERNAFCRQESAVDEVQLLIDHDWSRPAGSVARIYRERGWWLADFRVDPSLAGGEYALAVGLLDAGSPVSCAHLLDIRMPPSLLDLDEPTHRVQAGLITELSLLDRKRAVYPEAQVLDFRVAPPTRAVASRRTPESLERLVKEQEGRVLSRTFDAPIRIV